MQKGWEGYGKNWIHFVYKWTISFEVSGFQTKTRLLQRHFIFLNLFELQTSCVFIMHHSKPRHQFSTLSDYISYFSCIYWFFWAKMSLKFKNTTNELWNSWNLAWYHHFTHKACAKRLRGLRQKLDALRVQMDNLFRSITVSDENSSVTKGFQFF